MTAAAGFFNADPLTSPVTNAPKRGQQHLSDALCLLRQLGKRDEAEATFNHAAQEGRIPWRVLDSLLARLRRFTARVVWQLVATLCVCMLVAAIATKGKHFDEAH